MQSEYQFQVIGVVHSCFKEKFTVPRQPGLAPAASARLELLPPYNREEALVGLEQVSHIWLQFIFHQSPNANDASAWKPSVRPPRLGGNRRMGVFATRSPVRPNPLGLSVVKFEGIEREDSRLYLRLSGIDLVDGTPVVDIKPYVPYVDMVPEAENDFAASAPEFLAVHFSAEAARDCDNYQQQKQINLRELIVQILQQDPRPSYQKPKPSRVYGTQLLDIELRWHYEPASCENSAEEALKIVVLSASAPAS